MSKYQQISEESRKCSSDLDENLNEIGSNQAKGKRLWKKVKYQLVDYHSLPAWMKDNEFILSHYRAGWPIKQVLFSVFSIHNETLNIWTHLIGFFLFLALTVYTATKIPHVNFPDMLRKADLYKLHSELLNCIPSLPNMPDMQRIRDELKAALSSNSFLLSVSPWRIVELLSNCLPGHISNNNSDISVLGTVKEDLLTVISPLVTTPITRWPFFAFLAGAMFCLLASSTCHLLSCHSPKLSYIMLRLDYAGISALITTSFYPPIYYSFVCYPFFQTLYISLITIFGISTILFSLLPVFDKPEFRVIRASLFFGMGVSGAIPVLHKLILFWDKPVAIETTLYEIAMGSLYGIGALIYAKRIPERWMPGKFDIAGSSHQFFHILVVAGAFTHYCAGLVYLKWRDQEGCS